MQDDRGKWLLWQNEYHGPTQGPIQGNPDSVDQRFYNISIDGRSSPQYIDHTATPSLPSLDYLLQRPQLVEEIVSSLFKPNINAIALTGLSGIGKSTVAALVSYNITEIASTKNKLFSESPIWLDIYTSTTFFDVIGTLYKAFNKPLPDINAYSAARLAYSLFSLLNNSPSRLIILNQLDNILDKDTGYFFSDRIGFSEWLNMVNNQLLNSGSRLLFTSYLYPKIHNGFFLPSRFQEFKISGLSMQEGAGLLSKRLVDASLTDLRKAVGMCDGHVLSLMLLISLQQLTKIPLADLIEDATFWNTEIATGILDKVFTCLNSVQKDILYAISSYDIPVSIEAVESIFPSYTKNVLFPNLKSLLLQGIVQIDQANFYRIHRIVHSYSRNHFLADNKQTSINIVKTHEGASQYCMTMLSQQKYKGIINAFLCLEAISHSTKAHQWQNIYDVLIDYDFLHFLQQDGSYTDILTVCQQLFDNDEWKPQKEQKALIALHLGYVYETFRDFKKSIGYYEQSVKLFQEENLTEYEVIVLGYLGRCYCQRGNPSKGLQFLQIALGLCQNYIYKANIFSELGLVYRHLGDMEEALRHYFHALEIAKNAKINLAGVLNNIGEVYRHLGEAKEALKYYRQCLDENSKGKNKRLAATVLSNMGLIYQELGNRLEAIALMQQSKLIYQEIGDRLGELTAFHNEAGIYLEQEKYQKAIEIYLEILPLRREIEDASGVSFTLFQLSRGYAFLNKHQEAIEYALETLQIRRKIGDRFYEVEALKNLGQLGWVTYNNKKALFYYRQAFYIVQQIQANSVEEISLLLTISNLLQEEQPIYALSSILFVEEMIKNSVDSTTFQRNILIEEKNKIYQLLGSFSYIIERQIRPYIKEILNEALNNYRDYEEKEDTKDNGPIINISLSIKESSIVMSVPERRQITQYGE